MVNRVGTQASETLSGGSGRDILCGMGGNDTLFGGSGNDILSGADGNDRLFGGSGNDKLFGGSGDDRLEGGSGNDRLFGGTGDDRLEGGSGNDALVGGSGNDTMRGGSGDDSFDGGPGDDVMIGGSGVDSVSYYTAGAVRVDLAAGTVEGEDGNDRLFGIENVTGTFFGDVIVGNSADNLIIALEGPDVLTGGGGADTFLFTDRFDFGDTITDFQTGVDKLQFHIREVWPADAPDIQGPLTPDHFAVGTGPQDGDDWFFLDPDTHTLYWDGDGTGGGFSPMAVATFTGGDPVAGDLIMM